MKNQSNSTPKANKILNFILKLLLWSIAFYLFTLFGYTYKLLWFQYAPLCVTLLFVLMSNFFQIFLPEGKKTRSTKYMTPIEREGKVTFKLILYYAWELLIIIVQLVVIVLQVINTKGDFFDKATTLVCGIIMGVVAYVCLTGQGNVTYLKGPKNKKRRSTLNPTEGMEYVPSVNAYRDSRGLYYNGYGIPIPTPVSNKKDRR